MCLEDRFLFALYSQSDFVDLQLMANSLSITENALLSIMQRIRKGFPDYLLLKENDGKGVMLSPNPELQQEVRLFLAEGGFTAINEQELREYYEAEMKEHSRIEKIKHTLQQYHWMKWTAGFLFTIASGLGLTVLANKILKHNHQWFKP